MRRANALGTAVLLSTLGVAAPGSAQTEVGVDLDLFSSYVWRGLSLTNKPVAQPAAYISFPLGNAALTVGGWANVDLGSYDDPGDDIAEGGGTSFNISEFDPYAEVSYPLGKITLTGGVTGYIYPNDADAPNDFGLLVDDDNTVELYGKLGYESPLNPELSVIYDLDKIKGFYFEGAINYSLAAGENVSVELGALAGINAGQDCDGDFSQDTCNNSYNFAENGFTHLDLSAGVPLAVGSLSITPVIHFQINGDDATKITSPSNLEDDFLLWGGLSLSWSRVLGEEPEETAAE